MARSSRIPRGALALAAMAVLLSTAMAVSLDQQGKDSANIARSLASFTGTMNITVLDDAGRKMAGAEVKIAGNSSTPVTTGPDGVALIVGLYAEESGTSYFVWAAKQFYANSSAAEVMVYANATTNQTFEIRGSTVVGQVFDSGGGPIAGANVSISDVGFNLTGDDGMYQLLGVPSGLKSVIAASTGYHSNTTVISVPVGGLVVRNFVLVSLTGAISGYVLGLPNMDPLVGATVSITVFPLIITIQTDADGYYRIGNITAGIYNVTASMQGYSSYSTEDVVVLQGEETMGVNFTLAEKATRLFGTVKAGNVLKSKANVTVIGTALWTLSNYTGKYSLANISAGTYNVTASLAGYYTTTVPYVVILRGGETELNIELVPLPGGVLQGFVLASDSKAPLKQVNVTLIGPDSETYTGQTDPNGAFQIPALAPGNYTIQLEKEGYKPAETRNIVITPENVTARNFTMEPVREGFQGFFFGFDLAHSMMILALFMTILIFGIAVYLRMRAFQTPQNAPAVYDEGEGEPAAENKETAPSAEAVKDSGEDQKRVRKIVKRGKE